jgi:Protein of unknown function (DUF2905)
MIPMIGRGLIVAGIMLVLVGVLLVFFDKIPLLGKLPGDITIKKDNVQIFIPITTSILLSLLLTVGLWLVSHVKGD